MKKIAILSIILLTLTSSFAAIGVKELATNLFDKLFALSAEEVLSEKLCQEIWESAKNTALSEFNHTKGYDGVDLTSSTHIYTTSRIHVFQVFAKDIDLMRESHPKLNHWRIYDAARAVVINKFKNHLHEGENLAALYESRKEIFLSDYATMSEAERYLLFAKVREATETFEKMKIEDNQSRFTAWVAVDTLPSPIYNSAEQTPEELAETLVEVITEEKKKAFHRQFNDHHLAAFAGRRWLEGGNDLLDKYITILKQAMVDMENVTVTK